MAIPVSELTPLLVGTIMRFLRQNGSEPDRPTVDRVAARLTGLVERFGLPNPVRNEAESDRQRLTDVACAERAADAAGGNADPVMLEAIRQLVKALFYPELGECRDSFQATTKDGACKRQDLERTRRRVSGAHCVDCPHWRLSPEQHREFLAQRWITGAGAFERDAGVFLPEDFRRVRHWIAKQQSSGHTSG